MDSIRSILVHLDAGRHADQRLNLARTLAASHEARLHAMFAVAPQIIALAASMEGGPPLGLMPEEVKREHRERARKRFDRAMTGAGWPATWQELVQGSPIDAFAERALHADLLVLGQRDPHDEEAFDVPADFVEAVLLASGTPAIVVPYRGKPSFERFETVLVAWRPGREAAGALKAALPLLREAGEVHLVTWLDEAEALEPARLDVEGYLRLHEVVAVRHHGGSVPSDPGVALLSLAADVGADLLVMGCYGHGRARELLFGGATRTVLDEMRLPVLMAH